MFNGWTRNENLMWIFNRKVVAQEAVLPSSCVKID